MEYFEPTRVGDEYAVIPSPPPPPPAITERVSGTPLGSRRRKRVCTPDQTPKKQKIHIDALHKRLRSIVECAKTDVSEVSTADVEDYLKALSGGVASACTHDPPAYDLAREVLKATEAAITSEGVLGRALAEHDRLRMCAMYYSTCAVFCKHVGECEEAVRYCSRALRLFRSLPDSLPTDISAAELNLSAVLGRLKKHKQAAEHARSAIAILEGHHGTGPMKAVAHYNLAVELQYCKHHAEAREALNHAHNLARKHLSSSEPVAQAIAALYSNNMQHRPPTLANVKAIPRSSPSSLGNTPTPRHPGADYTPTTMGSLITTLTFPPSASPPKAAADGFGCWGTPESSSRAASSFLPPILQTTTIEEKPDPPPVPHPPPHRNIKKKASRRHPSPVQADRRASKKQSQQQQQVGFRNVNMSKNLYAQSYKRSQKHLAALAANINRDRKRREEAAITIQCAMRKCKANLELYNRKQLLYQCMHEKQSYISNLIKGKIQCWRAQKWVAEMKAKLKEGARARVEREKLEDMSATRIARCWRNYTLKENRAMRELVFEQTVMETRMRNLTEKCLSVQRWWRWVRIRKGYWRRRNREMALQLENQRAFELAEKSAIKLQSVWRGCLGLKEAKGLKRRLEKEQSDRLKRIPYAIDIVKYVLRSCVIRKRREQAAQQEAMKKESNVQMIVENWKSQASRSEESMYEAWLSERRGSAAGVIQRSWRCHRDKKKVQIKRVVQYTVLKDKQHTEAKQEWNAVLLQSWWRTVAAKIALREKKAALGRKIILATWAIQRWWRGVYSKRVLEGKKREKERSVRKKAKEAAFEEDQAARRIQCAWVMFVARHRFRARLADHQACKEIARRLAAVELIKYDIAKLLQRVGRGYVERLDLRMYGLGANFAAKCVQLAWKAYRSRQVYKSKKRYYEKRLQELAVRRELAEGLFHDSVPDLLALEAQERDMEVEDEYVARSGMYRAMHTGTYYADDEACSSSSGCYD